MCVGGGVDHGGSAEQRVGARRPAARDISVTCATPGRRVGPAARDISVTPGQRVGPAARDISVTCVTPGRRVGPAARGVRGHAGADQRPPPPAPRAHAPSHVPGNG
eukprot:2323765-Pyramimonas_sp.AAC.1